MANDGSVPNGSDRSVVVEGSGLELTSVSAIYAFAQIVDELTRDGHQVFIKDGPQWLATIVSCLHVDLPEEQVQLGAGG